MQQLYMIPLSLERHSAVKKDSGRSKLIPIIPNPGYHAAFSSQP